MLGHARPFFADQLGFLEGARRWGDLVPLRFGPIRALLVNHPDDIERVFGMRNVAKPLSARTPLQRAVFGRGLLASSGARWSRLRRLTQPAVASTASLGARATTRDGIERWLDRLPCDRPIDLHASLRELFIYLVGRLLLGEDAERGGRLLGDLVRSIGEGGGRQGTLRWLGQQLLPTRLAGPLRLALDECDRGVGAIIRERRAGGRQGPPRDALDTLVAARDHDGSSLDDGELRDAVITMVLAGFDTPAINLSWAIDALARTPDVEVALAAEADRTPSDLEGSACLANAVIKEALRLYPPNRIVGRVPLDPIELGGHRFVAGTHLLLSPWVVHRDPRFHGSPSAFRPERWLTPGASSLPRYAFFPFGGGARSCLGARAAMTQMLSVLLAFTRRFRFEPASPRPPLPEPATLVRPRGGMPGVLRAR